MNATEVKGSQGAGLVGGSDSVQQAVDDAQRAAQAAAEAARKAAEAAAAAAAERNAQKARELEAQAKAFAEAAAKAAQKASNAAAKLAGALENLENRGKADPKLATASEKATAAAKAAKTSATAAANSAAAATRSRQQKPVDRYENMKDRKLELNPPPPPSAKPSGPVYGPPAPSQEKKWHPPMAPPQPSPGLPSFTPRQSLLLKPLEPPKPLTPTERLELARERKLEQADRSAPPAGKPVPQNFSPGELAYAGEAELKQGFVKEYGPGVGQDPNNVPKGRYAFGLGTDVTFESQRSVKASPPRLQPGTGMNTVTFEVKQESKFELAPNLTADNWALQGKAGTKHGWSEEITYELTVPAKDADRYKQNSQLAPDPFDMRTLPVGSTLVVKVDDVRSTSVELEGARMVGLLPPSKPPEPLKPGEVVSPDARPPGNRLSVGGRVETGGAEITGRSVAVERVDEHTVRLLAGPSEGMKGAFSVTGFVGDEDGLGELSGKAEIERSFTSQTQKAVELDLRKPGADAAYAYFLKHGTLPAGPGSAGIETYGGAIKGADVYQSSYKQGGKLEAAGKVGQNTGAVSVGTEYGIDQKQTFNSDHTVGYEFTVNDGDRTLQINEKYDPFGNIDHRETSTGYTVQGAPPEVAQGFQRSFNPLLAGPPAPITGPQNLEVRLTQAEAVELNKIAQDYIKDWETQNNQTFNSAAQPMIWALAEAQSPQEVSTSLIQAGGRHEDYYGLTDLADFHQKNTGKRLPGTVNMVPGQ